MIFLYLAYLFFLGSLAGWVMEVLFRKFFSDSNPEHKWINPGFCVGPYVPLYGFGLCFLYLLADFGEKSGLVATTGGTIAVLVMMAASMTAVEYIAGVVSLKVYNLRLWDYSNNWGNLNGIICPLFSAIWAAIGAAYYYLLHPLVTELLVWLGNNLEFLFVVGFFFGVFTIDIVYSAGIVTKLRAFAKKNDIIIKYENLKAHIRKNHERFAKKTNFLLPFKSDIPLSEHLKNAHSAFEQIRARRK